MNKSDLIKALKNETALSENKAEKVVTTFFKAIKERLAKDGRVEIRGLGSFRVKQYKPYPGSNPKTGAQINVPAKKLPSFKVGKALKELVDDKL